MKRIGGVALCFVMAACVASADVGYSTPEESELARTPGIIVSGASSGALAAPLGAGGLVALRGFVAPDPVVKVQVRDDVAHLLVTTSAGDAKIVVSGPASASGVGEVVLDAPPSGHYTVSIDGVEPVELVGLVAPDVEFMDWMSTGSFSPEAIEAEGLTAVVDSDDFAVIWPWLEYGACRRGL